MGDWIRIGAIFVWLTVIHVPVRVDAGIGKWKMKPQVCIQLFVYVVSAAIGISGNFGAVTGSKWPS